MARMRSWIAGVALVGAVVPAVVVLGEGDGARPAPASRAAAPPLAFEADRGQLPRGARFAARGPGFVALLGRRGATVRAGRAGVLGLRFDGTGREPVAAGARMRGAVNVLVGDRRRWRTGIPTFGRVRYPGVWPGIDVEFYGRDGALEYDVRVAPGADPQRAGVRVTGVRGVRLARTGDAVVRTGRGRMRLSRPIAWQVRDGRRVAVAARFVKRGRRLGFAVGRYDRTRELVIDPVLASATYLGGNDLDVGNAVGTDAVGNVYIAGTTASTNLGVTPGTYQATNKGGSNNGYDVWVAKLSPAGERIYTTYLGGTDDDEGNDLAIDGSGRVHLTGITFSSDFPTTAGTVKPSFTPSGAAGNAFVTRLNADGTGLVSSTYLGGSTAAGQGIALDAGGNAYVTGTTSSADFPTTAGVAQASFKGANNLATNGFVTKLDSGSTQLLYSTFLSGSTAGGPTPQTVPLDVAVDGVGNAYVAGHTNTTDFPTTAGVLQATRTRSVNGFVTKLDAAGAVLAYSTYLPQDRANAVALDGGRAVTAGRDGAQAYAARLSATATVADFATQLGPGEAFGVATVAGGTTHVAGRAASGFPTTADASQAGFGGGDSDGFLTALDDSGTRTYATLLGGSGGDQLRDVAIAGERTWVGGLTDSTDQPTLSAIQSSNAGGIDAVLAAFTFPTPVPPPPPDTTAPETTITGGPEDFARINAGAGPPSYTFTSSEDGSSFLCRTTEIERNAAVRPWEPCASPSLATPQGEGAFVFEVQAIDAAGNPDATPASRRFRFFHDRLDTVITTGIDGERFMEIPAFHFRTAAGQASRFECAVTKIGGASTNFFTCSSPHRPDAEFIRANGPGDYRFEVTAFDAAGRGDTSPASRTFTMVPRAAYGNLRIRGIDVFQVVQPNSGAQMFGFPSGAFYPYSGGGTPTNHVGFSGAPGGAQTVTYDGVVLDPDKPTTAVAYVDVESGPPARFWTQVDVRVVMRADGVVFSDQTQKVTDLPTAATPFVTAEERDGTRFGVQFVIRPPRAVALALRGRDRFDVEASVAFNPLNATWDTRECDGRDCAPDNRFVLRNVRFLPDFGRLVVVPLRIDAGDGVPRTPGDAFRRTLEVVPGGESAIRVPPLYRAKIDVRAIAAYARGDAQCGDQATDVCRMVNVSAALDKWSIDNPSLVRSGDRVFRVYDIVAALHASDALHGGWADGPSNPNGTYTGRDITTVTATGPGAVVPRLVADVRKRPLTTLTHELGHVMSAPHASRACGSDDGAANWGESWRHDQHGLLQGTKFDARVHAAKPSTKLDPIYASPVKHPPAPAAPLSPHQELYDLMSYCAGGDTLTADGNAWISPYLWNRMTNRLRLLAERVPRSAPAGAASLRQATARGAYATGTVGSTGGSIVRVAPADEDASPPRDDPASAVRLRSLGVDGAVLQDAGVAVTAPTYHGAGEGGSFAGPVHPQAAAVELVRDGAVVDRVARTAAPSVQVTAPGRRTVARPGRDLVVRWTAPDADGGPRAREAAVEFSPDAGRTWRTVSSGPDTGSATVPGAWLQHADRARVRVRVNDGFSEGSAVSVIFRSLGSPPRPVISAPTPGERLQGRLPTVLTGGATDDTGTPLTGRALEWFAGSRRLGTGERVLVRRAPTRSFVLRLVARDGSGRTATATRRVRVAPPELRLREIRFAKTLPRSARRLIVRIRPSSPALLKIGRRSWKLRTRSNRLTVPLPAKPAAGVLRVRYTLSASGSKRLRGVFEVRRG